MSFWREFAYVQARLQAHHSRRAGPAHWQALESSHTLEHLLTLVRQGPLSAWVDGLDSLADSHRIEQHLRARWRRHIGALLPWLPQRWQPAVRWFGLLCEWPLWAAGAGAQDEEWVRWTAGVTGADAAPGPAWLTEWRRRLPPDAAGALALQRPAELFMPGLGSPGAQRAAVPEAVRESLLRLFRRHAASPVAVLAHLALLALDVERLRGNLVVRSHFVPADAMVGSA